MDHMRMDELRDHLAAMEHASQARRRRSLKRLIPLLLGWFVIVASICIMRWMLGQR